MTSPSHTSAPGAGASVLQVAGRPIEVLAPAALVAAPGVYLVIDAVRNFNDFRQLIDFDARSGWGFMLILITTLLLGLVLLWLAAGIVRGDRGARGAVYVLAGSWLLGYILAPDLAALNGRGGAAITGLVCLILAALALAVLPAAQQTFRHGHDDQPASIRMLLNVGAVIAVLLALCGAAYLLLAPSTGNDETRSYAVGAILLAAAAVAFVLGPMVRQKNGTGRLVGSVTMLGLIVAAFALLGQRFFIVPTQLITFLAVAWISLWVIGDARGWFGDAPLQTMKSAATTSGPAGAAHAPSVGDAAPPSPPAYTPPAPQPVPVAPTVTGASPIDAPTETLPPDAPTPTTLGTVAAADAPTEARAPEAPSPFAPPPPPAATPAVAEVTDQGADAVDCTRCGTAISADDRFCRGCGASAQDVRPVPPPPTCTGCGNELVEGDRFCPNCGTRVVA